MPRPTKLTEELIGEASRLIASGQYTVTVCEYLGICRTTWSKWMKAGGEGKNGLYVLFFSSIKKAEAEAEIRNVTIIQKAGRTTWQAAAWYLERKYPDRWGRRDRTEVTGKDGDAIEVELTHVKQRLIDKVNDIASREGTE